MAYKIGIDVGGTFTDFLLTDEDGTSYIYKILSTPKDPSIATIQGLEEMARDRDLATRDFLSEVKTIVHGTTVTTNATLTYNGARTGLLTTEGVRDALEMRRGIREEQYNNRYPNARPVVDRYLRVPVGERVDYAGNVLTPLNEDSAREGISYLKKEGVDAVAICFMNSFANDEQERRVADMVRKEMPDAFVSVSVEIVPAIRFYDRVSTTALNAYVGPILRRYLTRLIERLDSYGYDGVLLIMASNGGVISPMWPWSDRSPPFSPARQGVRLQARPSRRGRDSRIASPATWVVPVSMWRWSRKASRSRPQRVTSTVCVSASLCLMW